MGVIYLQQLREHFASFRVQTSLGVVLLFFLLNGVLSSLSVTKMQQDEPLIRRDVEAGYERVESINDAVDGSFRTLNVPTGTEFMSEGGFNWFWGSAWVSPETGVLPWYYFARDVNMWMDRFQSLDWTLIVRLVLSFLCIVLAYDGIAGEAERGTLRLVLAYPISRLRVLLAKFAAQLTVLLTAFLLGSLVSISILSVGADLPLTGHLFGRYLLYTAAVTVYLSLFLLLSLGVSCLSRSSVSALVLLTLAWAVINVILPQSSYLLAVRTVPVDSGFGSAAWEYRDDVIDALRAEGQTPRSRELAQADDYALEKQYIRVLGETEKEMNRLANLWLDSKVQRYRMARAVNMLSPSYAFQYTAEGLLGTGLAKRQNFMRQALEYRQTLRDFVRARDTADADSPRIHFLPGFMSDAPLDAEQIPRFQEQPLSPAQGLADSVVPAVMLLTETLLALLFAIWAVNRTDVTGYAVAEES
jgi:ABC-type transport system involved in multi-copper enzyme maturation permease subunit